MNTQEKIEKFTSEIREWREGLKAFGQYKQHGIVSATADSTQIVLKIRQLEARLAKLQKS